MNGDLPMRIKESQLRLLIRRELIRESNRRRRALREQADAAEEFEVAARDMDDDFNFDEEEAAIRASDPGELVLADNIKDYVQVQFGNARDGTPEERQDADRILSTVAVIHINNIAKYRSRDQGIIRTWKETIEDTRGGGYPVSLAALTAPSTPEQRQQLARGESVYEYPHDRKWEYTVKDEMWHTRKKGTDGRWISLSATKFAKSRGNLDKEFPDAREADESGEAGLVRSAASQEASRLAALALAKSEESSDDEAQIDDEEAAAEGQSEYEVGDVVTTFLDGDRRDWEKIEDTTRHDRLRVGWALDAEIVGNMGTPFSRVTIWDDDTVEFMGDDGRTEVSTTSGSEDTLLPTYSEIETASSS